MCRSHLPAGSETRRVDTAKSLALVARPSRSLASRQGATLVLLGAAACASWRVLGSRRFLGFSAGSNAMVTLCKKANAVGIHTAIDAGSDSIEHGDDASDEQTRGDAR